MCRLVPLVGLIAGLASHAAGADDRAGLAFFEAKIRPVLVKECYACHSAGAKKLKGGLRLDTKGAVLAGGDSGPAVVPGKPGESPLLNALKHDGLAMPPKGKLPDAVVADFEHWIKLGAPDPRDGVTASTKAGIDLEAGRKFWAYQRPKWIEAPKVEDDAWPSGMIDRFVLARLEAKGLRSVRDADRATLARRVWFDLVGLPPTPEEVDAFVRDPASDAYEKLVDRLLAMPGFGERWGRHWLDVARFGESLTLRGLILKDAWRYRDFVIDAFNADLPFDRFVRMQVAGDLLPAASLDDRRRGLVATSFLALGNNNLEEQDKAQLEMDVVDEQLDTLGKAFLAQTIGCARCHDHKFDPIPTKDYYALAGILRNARTIEHANVSKSLEKPLPAMPAEEARLKEHEQAVAALEARIKVEGGRGAGRGRNGVLAVKDVPGVVVDDADARKVGEWKASQYSGRYIGNGYIHDSATGKGDKTLTFQPDLPEAGVYEIRLAYTPGDNRAPAVPVTILSADGETTARVDMRAAPPIDGRFISLGRHRFEKNGQGYVLISNEGTTGHVVADAVAFIPADAKIASATTDDLLPKLEAELKRLKASGPKRETVLAVEERPQVEEIRVHVRGSVHTLGEPAPRGFLRVASYGKVPPLPSHASGRRELADWLASVDNPLTARVFVNRTWHWLFGEGLVRTVDNFGTTGELPTHPELLDNLAVGFINDGWSVKRLVRQIVLSRTYRLAAVDDIKAHEIDPENRLLWRANRRRLDAECLRDAMLQTSGRLDVKRGGPGFPATLAADYGFRAGDERRSVYLPVFRNALPEMFEVFDFADPSLVVGHRNASTVAPQALFLLNNLFAITQARHAARRLLEVGLDDTGRVERAYRLTLGRPPSAAERRVAMGFIAGRGEADLAILFQALYASADFRYID
jgi:cytochrome c553